jgi:hypothetical protein
MLNFNYTQAEAEALVGRRFETLVEWDRVTKGRQGRVIWSSGHRIWALYGPYEKYEVVIAWDLPPGEIEGREPPPQACFSKFQMEKYMREVKARTRDL